MASKAKLYIAISLDGFIARKDNALDWLPQPGDTTEDFGYKALYDSIGTTLMGRSTYEAILSFGVDFPYLDKRNIVFSSRNDLPIAHPSIEVIHEQPAEWLRQEKRLNKENFWLVGGSWLNGSLLAAGLVDEIIIAIIPNIIGDGIPLSQGRSTLQAYTLKRSEQYGDCLLNYYALK